MGRNMGAEKGTGQKFLPRRARIPRQTASFKGLAAQSACPGLCPVAWGASQGPKKEQAKNSYRGVRGFHGKWLPSRGWLRQEHRITAQLWACGSHLFRAGGDTAVHKYWKYRGFRNVLRESRLWKSFLRPLCPSRKLRESGSSGKVSCYKVWPYNTIQQVHFF